MMNKATRTALEESLKANDELISGLISDIVFLKSQIAKRDEIIRRYQSLVTEEEHHAKT